MYTAAELTRVNPVLLKGEVVYESDTRKRKVGDGVTAWKNLPYEVGDGGGGPTGGLPVDALTITTNIGLTKLPFTKEGQIIPVELRKDTPETSGIWTGMAICDGVGDNGYWQGTVFITANGYGSYWKTYVEYGYSCPAEAWDRCDFGGNLPESIPAANIVTDNLHRLVTDVEKATWNGKANTNCDNVNLVKSLAANGYYKAPDGLMIQWGYTTTASATPTVYFPTSFYGTPFVVIGSIKYSASNPPKTFSVSTTSMYTSYATFLKTFSTEGDTNSAVSEPFYWIAIGRWK